MGAGRRKSYSETWSDSETRVQKLKSRIQKLGLRNCRSRMKRNSRIQKLLRVGFRNCLSWIRRSETPKSLAAPTQHCMQHCQIICIHARLPTAPAQHCVFCVMPGLGATSAALMMRLRATSRVGRPECSMAGVAGGIRVCIDRVSRGVFAFLIAFQRPVFRTATRKCGSLRSVVAVFEVPSSRAGCA